MNANSVLRPAVAAFCLAALIPALSNAQNAMPAEMSALISAYSVGKLSAGNLQAACRWAGSPRAADPAMTQVRTQNIAFCDGFLAATVEFARLNKSALQSADPAATGTLLSCTGLSGAAVRTQFLASPDLPRMQGTAATDFLIGTLFICKR